ncbi:MAG: RNA polymerase sigma factor [Bacillota bacterium]|nr:RNA polymerase sigma factor [Bacillota bacterium]
MNADFLMIQKMRAGDQNSIDRFVEKYYPAIYKYCRLQVKDSYTAEDLTQETFIRFFESLERYKHSGKTMNYLYVIASNACRDYFRKTKEEPLDNPDEYVFQDSGAELRMDIQNAFESLPDEIREAAVLYFAGGLKQKDISRITGAGLPLVKYRIRRARELLSALLGKEDQ